MENISNTDNVQLAKARMNELKTSLKEGDDIINVALSSLAHLTQFELADKEYLLYLVNSDEFEIKHIEILDETLCRTSYLDVELYLSIIRSLVRFQFELKYELMQHTLRALCMKSEEDFQHMVVRLIVDSNGHTRRIGRDIWDVFQLQNSSVEITTFDEIIQFTFIVSMLQGEGNPNTRLPKLLTLLDSDSTIIVSVLKNQLRPYILSYRGHIITQLDKLDIANVEAVEEIKEYHNSISNFANERSNCKELNSEYNQINIVKEFAIGFQEYLKPLFKSTEESSILSLFKPVQIARGICSREDDYEELELPCIRVSTPAPTMISSLNEREKAQQLSHILMDWNTITKAEDLWKIL